MKKIIILVLAITALGISSCRKKAVTQTTSTYDGKWSLVSYNQSPMLGGSATTTYNPGEIIWDFNSNNQTVAVSVNPLLSTIPLGPGNYSYQLGPHPCNNGTNHSFSIGADNWGVFNLDEVANNKLEISAACLDGAILEFER